MKSGGGVVVQEYKNKQIMVLIPSSSIFTVLILLLKLTRQKIEGDLIATFVSRLE